MNIKLRYANNFSFAKVPFYDEKINYEKIDIGIIGIPFDSGCSYRCGSRFAPSSIRTNSCILREYNIKMDTQDLILAIIIIGVLFWYFNIRCTTKCIIYNPKCLDIKYIKQNFN
jgi:hypothetical protein